MNIPITEAEEALIDITKAIPENLMGLVVYAQPRTEVVCPDCLSDIVSSDLINFWKTSCAIPSSINRKIIVYCDVLKMATMSYATRINNNINLTINFAYDVTDPTTLINTSINSLIPGLTYNVKVLNGWKFAKNHATGPIASSQLSILRLSKPYPTINRICAKKYRISTLKIIQPTFLPDQNLSGQLYSGGPSVTNAPGLIASALSIPMTASIWTHDSNGYVNSITYPTVTTEIGNGYIEASMTITRSTRDVATATYNASYIGPNMVLGPNGTPTQQIYGINATKLVNTESMDPIGSFDTYTYSGWLSSYFATQAYVSVQF